MHPRASLRAEVQQMRQPAVHEVIVLRLQRPRLPGHLCRLFPDFVRQVFQPVVPRDELLQLVDEFEYPV